MKNSENRKSKKRASIGALTLLLTAIGTLPGAASAHDLAYRMTTIIDSAHGREVVAGQYDLAIEKIAASRTDGDAFFASTNLCVAYAKSGDMDDAIAACDAAVRHAATVSVDMYGDLSRASRARLRNKYQALALSNRGVLYAINGEFARAREDFTQALKAKSYRQAARVNLARLAEVEAAKA